MRYELSDNEWRAIRVMLPNQPRYRGNCRVHSGMAHHRGLAITPNTTTVNVYHRGPPRADLSGLPGPQGA